jgi:hypothetical protein
MFRFVLIAAVAVVLVQFVPGRASADIIQGESLDLAVMSADLVVRGKVIEIVTNEADHLGIVWNRVTFKVAETIMGHKFKEVIFLVRKVPFDSGDTAWRNQRDEMLLCLEALDSPVGPFGRIDFVLRGGAVALNGKAGSGTPIYSLDFKALTDPKEILTAARAAAEDRFHKPRKVLEWIVQGPEILWPHSVLYPDTERVRAAAKQRRIDLLPR